MKFGTWSSVGIGKQAWRFHVDISLQVRILSAPQNTVITNAWAEMSTKIQGYVGSDLPLRGSLAQLVRAPDS